MNQSFIHLASASPRRRELLQQIGVEYRVSPARVDESPLPNEAPGDYVSRLAEAKARATSVELQVKEPVLGADTTVVLGDRLLGKPADRSACLDMLSSLSEARHEVLTAVFVLHGENEFAALSRSQVQFRHISQNEMKQYWDSGEPADKAGGYSIQGLGAVFIKKIEGSYSGVMGLPLFETARLLGKCGIDVLKGSSSA
ncbi:MAG: septum formation inhibitor Maf [Gammaproteobacteria bacterium]|nr:septum formation inhibitor Maf [Gammaproteobacteria bacterium]